MFGKGWDTCKSSRQRSDLRPKSLDSLKGKLTALSPEKSLREHCVSYVMSASKLPEVTHDERMSWVDGNFTVDLMSDRVNSHSALCEVYNESQRHCYLRRDHSMDNDLENNVPMKPMETVDTFEELGLLKKRENGEILQTVDYETSPLKNTEISSMYRHSSCRLSLSSINDLSHISLRPPGLASTPIASSAGQPQAHSTPLEVSSCSRRKRNFSRVLIEDDSLNEMFNNSFSVSGDKEITSTKILPIQAVTDRDGTLQCTLGTENSMLPNAGNITGEDRNLTSITTNQTRRNISQMTGTSFIIPFNGDVVTYDGKVNGEFLVDAESMLPEVLINRELSALCNPLSNFSTPNFIRLLKAYVVRGSYPVELLSVWDEYNTQIGSENDRPSEYDGPNQLFLILGMAMGGVDLESYQMHNENEVVSVMLQLALSLLIAEEMIQFEHRDLHIGNVLAMESSGDIEYRYAGKDIILRSYGCKVSIIDFTLSRMTKGGTTIFRDLEPDEELFQGKNDYQFDIYRMMRAHNGGNWQSFSPKTNCMWLHYMSRQLIGVRKCKKAITKKRKAVLQKVFDRLLDFESLRSIFIDDEFYGILQKHLVMNTKT
uniref:non-specific serine/threonine protein kinase n=1 Tax=Heterorhabditis bacteriophora TaxID=37862 RepID=A0A1I7XRL6_HETBA